MPKKLSDNPAAIEAAAGMIEDAMHEALHAITQKETDTGKKVSYYEAQEIKKTAFIRKAKQILLAAEKAEGKQ